MELVKGMNEGTDGFSGVRGRTWSSLILGSKNTLDEYTLGRVLATSSETR